MDEFCPTCGAADNCADCDHTPPEIGSRVMARGWAFSPSIDDNVTVPPGTLGTVTGYGVGQIWVDWDNGSGIALVTNTATPDRWEHA